MKPVQTLEQWIPLKDGIRLAVRIWLPEDADQHPVPAILEYLPYRRKDATASRDALNHPYFAGHGYAGVRVDIRGTGDSEGVLLGEYLKQEQDDALEVIAWLADQPWCSGSVGMIGISWGGFNGLQIAARKPPALKAIISLCSTDDRYTDDIHMMGGCLNTDKFTWGATMLSKYTTPPDPEAVGERWREMWMERMAQSGLWVAEWHEHLRRDDFYKHGSICEDYGAVEIPVYLVGGWADGYSNAIFRMLKNLSCPRKGLVGPWAHNYPNMGMPGPAIGFLQECLRWWDQWLKGEDTGIMDEPMLRAWMQEAAPPKPKYDQRPGRWVAEEIWPSPRIAHRNYGMQASSMKEEQPGEGKYCVSSPQTVGAAGQKWCPHGLAPDLARDQREEAGGSLVFDSEPAGEPFEVLGAPTLSLEVAADRPNALVAVTLSEIMPDGAVTLLSYGLLNLTRRESHECPQPLEPGHYYRVKVRLNEMAHSFAKESRFRVAVSNAYWPTVWPSPERVTLTIKGAGSKLELPARPLRAEDRELADFAPVAGGAPLNPEILAPGEIEWRTSTDVKSGINRQERSIDGGMMRIKDIDWTFGAGSNRCYTIHPEDPLSARCEMESRGYFARGDWQIRIDSKVAMGVTAETFHIYAQVDAYEGEERVFTRNWSRDLPRDLV